MSQELLHGMILIEDSLDCMARGMTKEQFVSCCVLDAAVRDRNALAWDEAERLIKEKGTRAKALNFILREIDKER